ncbi:MAG: hypothetical protein AAFO89_04185 [Planctomycetota bacterium]
MNVIQTLTDTDMERDRRFDAHTNAPVSGITMRPTKIMAKRCCGSCATCPRRLLAEAASFAPPPADRAAEEPVGVVVTLGGLAATRERGMVPMAA